jgi:hypothetical protein
MDPAQPSLSGLLQIHTASAFNTQGTQLLKCHILSTVFTLYTILLAANFPDANENEQYDRDVTNR